MFTTKTFVTLKDLGVKWATLEEEKEVVFGTESTRGYRPKERRSEACEDLYMLEEVNGQHFMMCHQQCYSLFTDKMGLEPAEKRRKKKLYKQKHSMNPLPGKGLLEKGSAGFVVWL